MGSQVDYGMFEDARGDIDMASAWRMAQSYLGDKYHNGEWVDPRWLVRLEILTLEEVPAYLADHGQPIDLLERVL